MAGVVSLQEAVNCAKDALGAVSPQEMSAWIATTFGMTVKPVIVTVMLGKFLEQEHVERVKRAALEMAKEAGMEPTQEKPKRKRKEPVKIPDSSITPHAALTPSAVGRSGQSGCPNCGSDQYVFRGRRKADPLPGEVGPVMETKRCCRTCNHEWKTRAVDLPPGNRSIDSRG